MVWDCGLLFGITAAFLIHLFFIFRMGRVGRIQRTKHNSPSHITGVSVIVCAQNAADQLNTLIPELLDQNHKKYEVIVVNDHSNDHSLEVLSRIKSSDDRLRVIDFKGVDNKIPGKKQALKLGIEASKFDLLLLTDADCRPASKDWVQLMTAPLTKRKLLVLGYGGLDKKPGVLNALIRYETAMTASLYLGQAMAHFPYMGVGRNLAYHKSLLERYTQSEEHARFPSGDDDLLVNHCATAQNTSWMIEPDSFTWSLPKTTWTEWIRQKRRHINAAHHYRRQTQFTLGLYAGSILVFYTLGLLGIFLNSSNSIHFKIIMGLFMLRAVIVIWQLKPGFKRLKTSDLILWTPLLEPILICAQMVIFVWNRFSKPSHWN